MRTEAEVLDRVDGVCGELVLRRRGDLLEIVANGVFLMDSADGTSERLLVTAAADRMPAPGRVLVAGLGVGFSLAAALRHPAVGAVHVVEREAAVVRWNRGPLAPVHGDALADPRVRVHVADVVDWLAQAPPSALDAVCLDVDNGPDWLVSPGNGRLYDDAGLAAAARALAPGGVLAVWSAAPSPPFEERLGAWFGRVERVEVARPRGGPDVVLLASTRRL